MSYINFEFVGTSESGKTNQWRVKSNGILLGEVKWFSHWRKYVFFPSSNTLLYFSCLSEIADFINVRTDEHKSKA